MISSLQIPFIFSIAVGRPGIKAKSDIYALFLILPLTILLVYLFGLTGAALSIVCRALFSYAYAIPRICSECLNIPVKEFYWHVLKIFILIGFSYGLAWFALSIINNYSIISLAIAYICATITFLICSYTLIGDELKGTVFSYPKALKIKLVELAYMYETKSLMQK